MLHKMFFFVYALLKTKPALTLQEAEDLIRMYCLSVAFLHHMPLSQRAQTRFIENKWNEETFMFIQQVGSSVETSKILLKQRNSQCWLPFKTRDQLKKKLIL